MTKNLRIIANHTKDISTDYCDLIANDIPEVTAVYEGYSYHLELRQGITYLKIFSVDKEGKATNLVVAKPIWIY
jgi:hypothetical protein